MRAFCRLFQLVIAAPLVSSCATGGSSVGSNGNPTSPWGELASASSLSCNEWQSREEIALLDEIKTNQRSSPALLASATLRTGRKGVFFSSDKNGFETRLSKFMPLELGRGAEVAGFGAVGGQTLLAVLLRQNDADPGRIQIRNPANNVVLNETGTLPYETAAASVTFTPRGFWLVSRPYRGDSEGDLQRNIPYDVTFFAYGSSGKDLRPVHFKSDLYSVRPQLLLTGDRAEAFLIWASLAGESGNGGKFFIQKLEENGLASPAMPLAIDIIERIESWSAVMSQGRLWISFVDGDSLLGSAKLRAVRLDRVDVGADANFTPQLTSELEMGDVHLSEPFIISDDGLNANVYILKWIDEESTIGKYNVVKDKLESLGAKGVFPQGARITEILHTSGDYVALIRTKHKAGWRFSSCEID